MVGNSNLEWAVSFMPDIFIAWKQMCSVDDIFQYGCILQSSGVQLFKNSDFYPTFV